MYIVYKRLSREENNEENRFSLALSQGRNFPDLDRIRAQGSRTTAEDDPKWHHDDNDEQEATIIVPETSPESEPDDGERDVDDDDHHQSSTFATPRAFKRIFAIDHLSDAEETVQAHKRSRAGRIQDVMYAFLSDIVSVDTQIILTMDNAVGMISLDVWTHRKVISRYAMFSCLIRRSSATPAAAGSTTNILTLKVYHVSLFAMCTLLEFVYLGRIERSINLNLVSLSMSGTVLLWLLPPPPRRLALRMTTKTKSPSCGGSGMWQAGAVGRRSAGPSYETLLRPWR